MDFQSVPNITELNPNLIFTKDLMFNLDPPPGFQGLDPNKPIQYYYRNMPHLRQEGATYFVTFRLGDSLPQCRLNELRLFRESWILKHGTNPSKKFADKLAKEVMARVEKWLDQGSGKCHLQRLDCCKEIESAMHFFDGDRYELNCFVVMPNHVHLIVKPLASDNQPLEKILQSWKRHSAYQINKLLGAAGEFWQEESFDRIIRDEEHLYRVIQYIGRNPKMANLKIGEYVLWIRPEWDAIGWGFRTDG